MDTVGFRCGGVRAGLGALVVSMVLLGCSAKVDESPVPEELLTDDVEATELESWAASLEEADAVVDTLDSMPTSDLLAGADAELGFDVQAAAGPDVVIDTPDPITPCDESREDFKDWSQDLLTVRRGQFAYAIRKGLKGDAKDLHVAALTKVRFEVKCRQSAGDWKSKSHHMRKYRRESSKDLQSKQLYFNVILRWANNHRGPYFSEGEKFYILIAAYVGLEIRDELRKRGAGYVWPIEMLNNRAQKKLRKTRCGIGGTRGIGCEMAAARGWTGSQWSCLEKLWTKESQWQTHAVNRSSGACGIPQSLPCSKMSSHGGDYRTNPRTQIAWGLDYIRGRYGSPCGAWNHSQRVNWY